MNIIFGTLKICPRPARGEAKEGRAHSYGQEHYFQFLQRTVGHKREFLVDSFGGRFPCSLRNSTDLRRSRTPALFLRSHWKKNSSNIGESEVHWRLLLQHQAEAIGFKFKVDLFVDWSLAWDICTVNLDSRRRFSKSFGRLNGQKHISTHKMIADFCGDYC